MKYFAALLIAVTACIATPMAGRAETDWQVDIGYKNGSSVTTDFDILEGINAEEPGLHCGTDLTPDPPGVTVYTDCETGNSECGDACGTWSLYLYWCTSTETFATAKMVIPAYGDPYLEDETNSTNGGLPTIKAQSNNDTIYDIIATYE